MKDGLERQAMRAPLHNNDALFFGKPHLPQNEKSAEIEFRIAMGGSDAKRRGTKS